MKKLILSFLVLALLIFIASCTKTETPKVVCGDSICDQAESCSCDDCKSEEKCKISIIGTCDDKNSCTEDIFNELTKQCEHKTLKTCCGNDECEENERCNKGTYETLCPSDCPYECPAKVTPSKFECASENCKELSEDNIEISGNAVIKSTMTNIGERGSSKLTSEFRCDGGSLGMIKGDNSKIKGITFKDYFGNNEETAMINSRISKLSNTLDYNVEFTKANTSPLNINCVAVIQDSETVDLSQKITLSFK